MISDVLGVMIFPAVFFLILFSILFMVLEKKGVSLLNVYLTLVSFVALIGLVVGFGTAIQQLVMGVIVTDEEYARYNRSYELDQCSASDYKPGARPTDAQVEVKKTDAQVADCKAKKIVEIAAARRFDIKQTSSIGLTWGVLFLIVFLAHYPRFVRQYKASKEEAAQA